MGNEINGRTRFIWSGQNRQADTAALMEAIVAAVPGLCNHDGSIARLDGAGGLSPVNLETFKSLLDKHLCGVRVVSNGSGWGYDFYAFDFPHKPNLQPTMANPNPYENWGRAPDADVLDQIYRHDLVLRLPRVVT